MMKLFDLMLGTLDARRLVERTERLWRAELGQTTRDRREAAALSASFMRESGLANVEELSYAADGTTTYQDKTAPLAWEAARGSLTVVRSPIPFDDPIVADYARHPYHLVHGSVATPPQGLTAPLVSEERMLAGQDVRGAFVLTAPETRPRAEILAAALDLGALGLVNDSLSGRYLTPDAIQWVNACTEGNHWHVRADDRPFICYSISPRTGDALRAAVRAGEVLVRAVSDGRRYAGKFFATTGILPGRDPREVWVMAHLAETMPDDNSAGVVAAIEIARAVAELARRGAIPAPRFTIRLVFAMEMYGFAAFADDRIPLHDSTIGALNIDGMPLEKPEAEVWLSPPGSPFCGDYLMERLYDGYAGSTEPVLLGLREEGMYADDMFLADASTGLRTNWVLGRRRLWHNSEETMARVNPTLLHRSAAFNGAWTAALACLDGDRLAEAVARGGEISERRVWDEARSAAGGGRAVADAVARRLERERARLADFLRISPPGPVGEAVARLERAADGALGRFSNPAAPPAAEQADPWTAYARTIVPRRASPGFPYDLAAVPKDRRRPLPDTVIYGPFARILSGMDGRRDLAALADQAAWESGQSTGPAAMRGYIGAVEFLTEHGYLETSFGIRVARSDIVRALRANGVRPGGLVMLHSGLARMGHIEGGPDAVIDAFLEALGPAGTLLAPTFSRSFISFDGAPLCNRRYRPHDPASRRVWVGAIPAALLARPGVVRSAHVSHSVAGIGPLAAECLADQREDDPPTCARSPFGKLRERDGLMVWFGAGMASTTFFHLLETEADLPYLGEAVCRVRRPDGRIESVVIRKHLPGHRDFYREPAEETRMYRRLIAAGLEIARTPLGAGEIKSVSARRMYDLGMEALRREPDLLLCEDPACRFCSTHRARCGKGER